MCVINQLFRLALSLVLCGCIHASAQDNKFNDSYPDAWWVFIPPSELKSWEIPPQNADRSKSEVILSKRTELGIFSNLSQSHFELDGVQYASVEGLWQGMKYPEGPNDERLKDPDIVWPYTREQVYKMSGFESKAAGDAANANMKKLGIKWITYKGKKIEYKTDAGKIEHYNVIYRASVEKVAQNPEIKALLLKTGSLKFLPDHVQQPNPDPAYRYFDIFVKIRTDLQQRSKQ
jgi:predicted NAD-dependent protein-ADP-ribosyltransferase YbiA (DUF1768 family)